MDSDYYTVKCPNPRFRQALVAACYQMGLEWFDGRAQSSAADDERCRYPDIGMNKETGALTGVPALRTGPDVVSADAFLALGDLGPFTPRRGVLRRLGAGEKKESPWRIDAAGLAINNKPAHLRLIADGLSSIIRGLNGVSVTNMTPGEEFSLNPSITMVIEGIPYVLEHGEAKQLLAHMSAAWDYLVRVEKITNAPNLGYNVAGPGWSFSTAAYIRAESDKARRAILKAFEELGFKPFSGGAIEVSLARIPYTTHPFIGVDITSGRFWLTDMAPSDAAGARLSSFHDTLAEASKKTAAFDPIKLKVDGYDAVVTAEVVKIGCKQFPVKLAAAALTDVTVGEPVVTTYDAIDGTKVAEHLVVTKETRYTFELVDVDGGRNTLRSVPLGDIAALKSAVRKAVDYADRQKK